MPCLTLSFDCSRHNTTQFCGLLFAICEFPVVFCVPYIQPFKDTTVIKHRNLSFQIKLLVPLNCILML